ncbi:hypothetical protein OG738_29145 [Amycolatopsis sp. NBC_01488]|uniref:hypothetical protein n=1 Tax=Amycolatopsis sp. NBC_01488 TaxID=2903563 RepID=UPI002E2BF1A0|nr:hypothetical protein [Amycolatopsis sp. NBC_01488]
MTGPEQAGARPDLLAVCDVCLQLMKDGAGAVWWHPAGGRRGERTPPSASLTPADRQDRWRITHDECEPGEGYRIAVERIRTWPAYLRWTAHLMAEDWFAATDWRELVLDTLDPVSISAGIRPRALRDIRHRDAGERARSTRSIWCARPPGTRRGGRRGRTRLADALRTHHRVPHVAREPIAQRSSTSTKPARAARARVAPGAFAGGSGCIIGNRTTSRPRRRDDPGTGLRDAAA